MQRRLRKITANPESRHGEFAPTSNFAGGLQEYAHGDVEFVEFSHQIAQWFWEELRRADDVEQCDLLVADYIDTDAGQALASAAADDEDAQAEAFEGEGRRLFAIVLLPRKQAFIHDVNGSANEIFAPRTQRCRLQRKKLIHMQSLTWIQALLTSTTMTALLQERESSSSPSSSLSAHQRR